MTPQRLVARSRWRRAAACQFFAAAKVLHSASGASMLPSQWAAGSRRSLVPSPFDTWMLRGCALRRPLGQAQAQQLHQHPVFGPWRVTVSCFAFAGMVVAAGPAWAEDDELWEVGAPGHWRVAIGPYTWHLNQRTVRRPTEQGRHVGNDASAVVCVAMTTDAAHGWPVGSLHLEAAFACRIQPEQRVGAVLFGRMSTDTGVGGRFMPS